METIYRDIAARTQGNVYIGVVGPVRTGKSTLINKLVGNKKAKVENRPGVTVDKAWYSTSIGIDLMDMPGLLWPKFEDHLSIHLLFSFLYFPLLRQ